jgi:Serine hydrolase (FSH1)
MGAQFDGPFYSHTAGYAPNQMVEAIEHLEATMDELGPFDGVVGFSQGAALAISYIYDQQTRGGLMPFTFALLFSSVFAFSPNPEHSRGVVQRLCARRCDLTLMVQADDSPMTSDELVFHDAIVRVLKPLRENQALLPDIELGVYTGGDGAEAPTLMLPQLMSEKICIPTVHISGKRDAEFMRDMSSIARDMFDKKLMRTLEHSGSHEPPQKEAEVRTAVRAMEWAIRQSQKMGSVR